MKSKKLLLPAIILAVAILATVACSVISSIAFKPKVTEGEFPFSITYEMDGKTVTIKDVYKVNYLQNNADDNHKGRTYVGKFLNSGNDNTSFVIKQDENMRVELWTYLYPDYLMGDPEYDDYFEEETFEPKIYCYSNDEEIHDEEALAAQGIKLISFEYPTAIENSLVFSHMSYLNCEVVLPLLLIALLSLIATIIFVRKEKELKYKAIDIVSIVFNFIIGISYMGFVTVLALMIDITGGGPELYYQVMYFIPAFSVLCISASVALRRKGYSVLSLIIEFVGPVAFVLYLIMFYIGGEGLY